MIHVTTAPHRRASAPAAWALASAALCLTLGACNAATELDQNPNALFGDGGAGKPTTGVDGGVVPPGNSTAPADSPAACSMKENGNEVCVVCTDGAGRVVKDGCYTKEPKPANDDCYDVRRTDGSLCMVCFDGKGGGGVTKASCRAPMPRDCDLPGPPVACKDFVEKDLACTLCVDANGREVKRDCHGPVMVPPTPPGMPACKETKRADGSVCSVCLDPMGNVIKQGCTTTMPPEPAPIKCRDYEEKGQKCTECVDAKGTVIKQGCWQIMDPTTGTGGGAGTPGTTPSPPLPPECKETRKADGTLCVTCFDAKGGVIKEACGIMAGGTPAKE